MKLVKGLEAQLYNLSLCTAQKFAALECSSSATSLPEMSRKTSSMIPGSLCFLSNQLLPLSVLDLIFHRSRTPSLSMHPPEGKGKIICQMSNQERVTFVLPDKMTKLGTLFLGSRRKTQHLSKRGH